MKTRRLNRRAFVRDLGLSAASLPFIAGLPSLHATRGDGSGVSAGLRLRKQRLVIMISPNGTVPSAFWPDEEGKDFELKRILM